MIMGASAFASSAYAADVGKTIVADAVSNNVGGIQFLGGSTFSAANTASLFSDKYLFTLTGNYDASGTLSSTYLSTTPAQDLVITGYSLVKYGSSLEDIVGTYAGTPFPGSGAGTVDFWSFNANGLTAGNYYISVQGVVQGAGGGTYSSDVNLALAPVPEPETYAMMVAGLGLLGFVARRKKNAKQA